MSAPISPVLAYALMPTENFAQKRADNLMAMQLRQMQMQQVENGLARKQQSLNEVQQTLSMIDSQDLLPVSKQRLNQTFTEKWKGQIEDELKNKYGGDVVRFRRERRDYLAGQFARELETHPAFTDAIESKANYGFIKDAETKGHTIVGDWRKDYQDFQDGTISRIPFRGAYESPKNWQNAIRNENYPGSKYGRNGQPIEASVGDVSAALLNAGMGTGHMQDYLQKLGITNPAQHTGLYWKMEQESPLAMAQYQRGLASDASTRRHQKVTEDIQWYNAKKTPASAADAPNIAFSDFLEGDYTNPYEMVIPVGKEGASRKIAQYQTAVPDVKFQADIIEQTGLLPLERFVEKTDEKKNITKVKQPVTTESGSPVYSGKNMGLRMVSNPTNALTDPNAKVYDLDATTVYKMNLDGKAETMFIRGKANTFLGVREVYVPLVNSEAARLNLRSKTIMTGSKTERVRAAGMAQPASQPVTPPASKPASVSKENKSTIDSQNLGL